MKQIIQSVDVAFCAPTFKEGLKMAPLMDALVAELNERKVEEAWNKLEYKVRHANEKAGCFGPTYRRLSNFPYEQLQNFYDVLVALGFESSLDRQDAEPNFKFYTAEDLEKEGNV